MKILSTLSKVVSVAPKPPLSLLRLGGMTTPVGAGLVVASIVGVEAFKHKDEIGSTLGNIASNVKQDTSKVVNTTESIAGIKPSLPSPSSTTSPDSSMIVPLLVVGGLVVVFFAMRK